MTNQGERIMDKEKYYHNPRVRHWGRWFKYNLISAKMRSRIWAYAETSETGCSGDGASCKEEMGSGLEISL
jgi:hypothetical protein